MIGSPLLVALLLSIPMNGSASPSSVDVSIDAPCDASGLDSDRDGLSDVCEFAAAAKYAPLLNVSAGACNVIHANQGDRLGGGYLYAVAPIEAGIRIAYLPAYFRDCGWHGLKCHLPGVNCAPHWGDSEFIVVEVKNAKSEPVSQAVAGVFLSAHCFGKSGSNCKWYRNDDLRKFKWTDDKSPVVWVAAGRNANYPSRSACEHGHWHLDTCAGRRIEYRFPVSAASNIGSRSKPSSPRGCVSSQTLDARNEHTAADTVECLWDQSSPFRGWQKGVSGVTPYSRYLDVFAQM